jgi:hypothetical protein
MGTLRHSALTGEENNLHMPARQHLLKPEPIEPRHLDVQHEARRAIVFRLAEKLLRGGKGLCHHTRGAKKAGEAAPNGFVIIHNEYFRMRWRQNRSGS